MTTMDRTLVRIINNPDGFDGAVLPSTEVLDEADGFFGKAELAAGEGIGEWATGTRCRIVKVALTNRNPRYVLGRLFEYDGERWNEAKGGCINE